MRAEIAALRADNAALRADNAVLRTEVTALRAERHQSDARPTAVHAELARSDEEDSSEPARARRGSPAGNTTIGGRHKLACASCGAGFYDSTGCNANYWGCGAGCAGGAYWTDGFCNCACQPAAPSSSPTLTPAPSLSAAPTPTPTATPAPSPLACPPIPDGVYAGYTCDDGWSLAGYSCATIEAAFGYDCSGCACIGDQTSSPTATHAPSPSPTVPRAVLLYEDAECLSQTANLGDLGLEECAIAAAAHSSCGAGTFMYSSQWTSWGCRCCSVAEGGDWNPY